MRFEWKRRAGLIWCGFAMVWMVTASPAHALTFLTEENPPLNFTRDGKLTGVSVFVLQELAKRAGIPAVKEVFSGLLSQDYFLACNLNVPAEQLKAMNDALAGMGKDGTLRQLTSPRSAN